ncbi:acyl carrier protein [Janthinobacterium agaricidamnosum]|uniref:Carrier domain-containing protein n=1 Tax=Janthinobacterium agaricidamnosum NBRC 102515 = DSM 9628 TaxID=1349767 RepID=W0V7Q3_9BURK|nr:acyl carrier protein [Janthinobacterium agaricidamnosum]CDG83297.1 putative uncharacterized protein [Janthinobacterium agaricidamnosum NBRC 102515 = DSM 9628]
MPHLEAVKHILSTTLGLGRQALDAETPLLGSIPELDSMAVVNVITALEGHFGIAVADDEIHARHFSTVATLAEFVREKLR